MLDSCLKMGSSLLEYWDPQGRPRSSSSLSERDFQRELQNFFSAATCTNYDADIRVRDQTAYGFKAVLPDDLAKGLF